jgi:4-diphosphocytidyl-2C-methyl-D-erythritol 2-phosphate synthase
MVAFPHCKINLGLRVLSKRSDGYHNIETCFYPVPWTDILEIIPSDQFEFTSSGLEIAGAVESNLCVKAYRLLQNDFNLGPVKIHLHKIVPMGAGLGGGSSDAAFALRILNSIFDLKLSVERFQHYASLIGSDCAFFSQDAPMIGTGRGEILREANVSLKDFHLVLIKPDVHVSTVGGISGC